MKLAILVDNPKSWMAPYAHDLEHALQAKGHEVAYCERAEDITKGDAAFFLSCENIVPKSIRDRNKYNLVVHESDVPRGRGWSPLTWQILEGKNEVAVTLLEAVDSADAGGVYAQEKIVFDGTELVDELRRKQAEATIALVLGFVDRHPNVAARKQEGQPTYYERRWPEDNELDPTRSIMELFNRLRVADNERYPAFFTHKGRTYVVKIFPKE